MRLRAQVLSLAVPVLASLGYLVFAGGGGIASGTVTQAADPALVERGRELFVTGCAGCHGADARGTDQGPTLWGVGEAMADFQLSTGRMPLADPAAQAVRKPVAYRPGQIDALVAYVGSLGGGTPIPDVNLRNADLANGFELFRINCAPCHSAAGNGGALSYGRAAPPLHEATSLQIAEAVRTGPGQMPVFGPDTLTDGQVHDVVAYVRNLRDPADPGGFSLGHAGPIPEGLLALLVGVGGLVFIAGRIEAKS